MITYLTLRFALFWTRFISFTTLHRLGTTFGHLLYYCHKSFRKRTLSHISLAQGLRGDPLEIAKKSFANLVITMLEYEKLAHIKNIHQLVTCKNPELAESLINSGQGVIFFCGHQANWEVLFLEGTTRMPGVAIGRATKNKHLYAWITKIREKSGGTMLLPKDGIKESLRALKQGKFVGIVGDQGMPDSGYQAPFLGRNAWTSPIPALLAIRTGAPIFVATTKRENGRYYITYSDPIWPRPEACKEEEVKRLMGYCLTKFETSILETPDQWLWQHNRWKQQSLVKIYKAYRHDAILLILPAEHSLKNLDALRAIYPLETLAIAKSKYDPTPLPSDTIAIEYYTLADLHCKDYRFKFVINLSEHRRLEKLFSSWSALKTLHASELKAKTGIDPLEDLLGCLQKGVLRAP